MREYDYRDRYQRKLSRMRAMYRRRVMLVFLMALILGFLLGWIIYGRITDNQATGTNGDAVLAGTSEPTGTPEATWFDEADETEGPTVEPSAEPTMEITAEPTEETAAEPTAEATDETGMDGFMSGTTEAPTAEPTAEATMEATAEPTAEPTAETTTEPTAETTTEPTTEVTMEPTPAPTQAPMGKGSIADPVLMGEAFSFTAQINADGTRRTELSDDLYYDVPMTVTLSRYLLPDYYEETYATQFQLKGDEAGAQLDIALGAVDGLASVSIQDAVLVVYQDANGQVVQGYKFTDAEIGGESQSILQTGAEGTIYKRFKYDPAVDLQYLALTYYNDAQPTTVYFSLTESAQVEETMAPEASLQPTQTAAAVTGDESYTIGSTGDGVKQLQQKLIDMGYLYGTPDGKFGKYTEDAVKRAQGALGFEQTGIADATFLDALYKKQKWGGVYPPLSHFHAYQ